MSCRHPLPGFRTACLVVASLDVLLGASVLLRGAAASMAEYEVPAATLASPHYVDAITWVYVHMVVIGLMIGIVGLQSREAKLQRWFARLMLVVHACYLVLDVRTSDSTWGNGLYQGPTSIIPAVIGLCMLLLFVHPSVCNDAAQSPTEG